MAFNLGHFCFSVYILRAKWRLGDLWQIPRLHWTIRSFCKVKLQKWKNPRPMVTL